MQLLAADLGVDASFIEKDWHAIRLVAALNAVDNSAMRLVFSGGTSLSKGYGLIQRFSEDLDFKVVLPATGFNRNECRNYRRQLVESIRQGSPDWLLDDKEIESRNQGRFFNCQIVYRQNFAPALALRPQIRLEITFKPPALPFEERPLQSFIAQAMRQRPEVTSIACVSPVETAADKLSALTWRVLSRRRGRKGDDPALIRHLHDLTALEEYISAYENFPNLVVLLLAEDARRDRELNLSTVTPMQLLQRMLLCLEDDPIYANEYERFVVGMSYATETERPSFSQALDTARRIISRIEFSLAN